jgi:L-asparaginase
MRPFKNVPIGVLKVFPGIQFGLFESIMTEKLSGIVLETFGAGNIPSDSGALIPIISRAFESGTVITVCSQCPSGTVTLGAYETSSALKAAGAVSGFDMTTEAAVAKLYYLFSLDLTKDQIKEKMEENLRGELS